MKSEPILKISELRIFWFFFSIYELCDEVQLVADGE